MKRQLTHFSIHQSSKVIATIYFVFIAIFAIPWGIYVAITVGLAESLFIFLAPLLYFIISYVAFAIFAFVYNLVAGSFGGIEYTSSKAGTTAERDE
jgi:hypothetical protein